MNVAIWFIVLVAALMFEAITVELVAIWFVPGAIVSAILACCGCNMTTQLVAFILTAFATLLLFRKKLMDKLKIEKGKKHLPENVGEIGTVIETVDEFKGRIWVSNMDWAARSKNKEILEKGEQVIIEAVEGVTLIVSKNNK